MSGEEKVCRFPPSDCFSADQALASARQRELREVLIVGIYEDETIYIQSSRMSRERAVYLLEHARMHALGY